jgi:hypothetical protein
MICPENMVSQVVFQGQMIKEELKEKPGNFRAQRFSLNYERWYIIN